MTTMNSCRVCHQSIDQPLYLSQSAVCITSICEVRPERTEVSFCTACGHLQTQALADLGTYYDQDYKILIDSDDEDQLYAVVNNKKVFRTEHQIATLLGKLKLAPGSRVLDYGCAKSSTLRRLAILRPDLDLHVFDVSDMYLPFWRKFIRPENWAVYEPKPEWKNQFDLITSFFALEHVADPGALVWTVEGLLKPGGHFYCIVPNVYANTADFVVADHVNHFSAHSLRRLILANGLEVTDLDDSAHAGAWVLVASKECRPCVRGVEPGELATLTARTREMAEYWQSFSDRVRSFEQQHANRPAAIYGSGFYGTFIATCLSNLGSVSCFLDQNPHRQKQTLLGRNILPPEQIPGGVNVVYVGLNPSHARESIAGFQPWHGHVHTYFFP